MPSEWNLFVKKIYEEGKAKDSTYEFKQALKDASKRKSEMKNMSLKSTSVKKSKSSKSSKSSKKGGRRRKTRKNRH
jgi:hypothetical protein